MRRYLLSRTVGCTGPFSVASGGALFNAGGLDISDTVFAANTAGEAGLAVHDEVSLGLLLNVTFRDNMFSCPSGQYSDAHHVVGTFVFRNVTERNMTVSWTNRYRIRDPCSDARHMR